MVERVFAAFATIAERSFVPTAETLLPQVDALGIFFNYAPERHPLFEHPKVRVAIVESGAVGDRGKFHWATAWDGIYCTADDDLVYPPNYVRYTRTVLAMRPKHIVTHHGGQLYCDARRFWDRTDVRVHCLRESPRGHYLNLPGTGVMAFRPREVPTHALRLETANAADLWVALWAQEHRIPIWAPRHEAGWISAVQPKDTNTLYRKAKAEGFAAYDALVSRREVWELFDA